MQEFNASLTMSVLGLTLFVIGYGVGPMILTPLQELPAYGRNPVYMIGMLLFVLFELPIIYAPNLNTILAFRFLTGVVGSPALATGGASLGDMWAGPKLPYAIATWAVGAVCGPCLGPVVAGFAAMNNGWQWPMIILAWLSAFAWVVMMIFLPETLGATILHKRAARLRKLTGNENLRAPTELVHREFSEIAYEALVIPFKLLLEPAVFVVSLYLGLVYGIFYLFFESCKS
jgi:DHA1 family multidrug resistance protein-like MFS transporter